MAIFIWILAGICGAALCAVLVVLFVPVRIQFHASSRDTIATAAFHMVWGHAWFFRVAYDIDEEKTSAVFLNRFRFARVVADVKETAGDQYFAEPDMRESPPRDRQRFATSPAAAAKKARRRAHDNAGAEAPESAPGRAKSKKHALAAGERKSFRRRFRENKVRFVLRQGRWLRNVLHCLRAVVRALPRCVVFDHFEVRVRAGSEDPAEVGAAYGYLAAARSGLLLHARRNVVLELEPVFDKGDVLEYEADIGLRTSGARLLAPVFVLLWTFPYVSTFIVWRRLRKLTKTSEQ